MGVKKLNIKPKKKEEPQLKIEAEIWIPPTPKMTEEELKNLPESEIKLEKDRKIAKIDADHFMEVLMVHFVDKNPFFSEILTNFKRFEDFSLPTIGVYIKDQQLHMPYNPDWLFQFPLAIQSGLVKHEVSHIILNHLARFDMEKLGVLANIATDLSINGNLVEENTLPKEGQFYHRYGYPAQQTAEQYLKLLRDQSKKQKITIQTTCPSCGGTGKGKKGKGSCPTCQGNSEKNNSGDHTVWMVKGDSGGIDENLLREIVKAGVAKAQGNIPGNLMTAIKDILQPPKVNWRVVVRSFANKTCRGERQASWIRWNRRLPGVIKGRKRANIPKLVALIDASGSISDKQLEEFVNEIRHIAQHVPVHIIVFDMVVHDSYEFKKVFKPIKGRGGTSFEDAFKAAKKIPQVGGIVMLTDGYGTPPRKKDGPFPETLVVLTRDGDASAIPHARRSIRIDV